MLEAVGHDYYAEWFKRCDDLLAEDGLVVVQVRTISPISDRRPFVGISVELEILIFKIFLLRILRLA